MIKRQLTLELPHKRSEWELTPHSKVIMRKGISSAFSRASEDTFSSLRSFHCVGTRNVVTSSQGV